MFLPIGLDETRVSRLPWISIGILALNVLVFLGTGLGGADDALEERYQAVVRYWVERPYLELPAELDDRLGLSADRLGHLVRGPRPTGPAADAASEQVELDTLCQELIEAQDAVPERRFALVPARGAAQPGWITHLFLHGGFLHLLGNMLVFFLVVGPFLEDAWGRPFFLAFFLAGGALAGAAQALPMGHSQAAIVGASGAISACLGAFALRFAHRRVRIFYWLFLVVRGTFFVPAWLYAFFGLGMDLLGLQAEGTGGEVAYGAHVGGFLFGLAVALGLRLTGLEARIAPDGVDPPGGTPAGARAAEAQAGGRADFAREQYQELLRRDPEDAEALLGLARIAAGSHERAEASRHLERLVVRHLSGNSPAAARSALLELGDAMDCDAWRPSAAFRAGELVASEAPLLADRLQESAARAGGPLAAKALLAIAERARATDPARALEAAERVHSLSGLPGELAERAAALSVALRPGPGPGRAAPGASTGSGALPSAPVGAVARPGVPPGESVRVAVCRLLALDGSALQLLTAEGKRASLELGRVAAVAAGLVAEVETAGETMRNRVLLDLLLAARDGERGRVVVRIPGHAMPLARLFPGVPPQEAYGQLVESILAASGAPAVLTPAVVAGRPFARFPDVAGFESTAWGRPLSA